MLVFCLFFVTHSHFFLPFTHNFHFYLRRPKFGPLRQQQGHSKQPTNHTCVTSRLIETASGGLDKNSTDDHLISVGPLDATHTPKSIIFYQYLNSMF
jgi:hypothetical protein